MQGIKNEAIRLGVNALLDNENPGPGIDRCMCCGELLPAPGTEESGKIKIWLDTWLGYIVWVCPKCSDWLGKQREPAIAFQLALIKRAEAKHYIKGG